MALYLTHPLGFPQKELFIVIDSDGGMHVQTGDDSRVSLLHKHNESHLALSSDSVEQVQTGWKTYCVSKTTDICASYKFKSFVKAHLKPKKKKKKKKSSHFEGLKSIIKQSRD